ncbi:CBS domain-containing protein [Nonomuraea sp. NPDC050786]|uniref:CBS domain-containing protein n=1 Tax=Nonomuraea sp. NPDC050786 TaxID=3154840 RepID=UPI0033EF18BE
MDAIRLMDEHGIICLPVVDDHGRLVGVLSRHDLDHHFAWVDTSAVQAKVKNGVVTLYGRTRAHSEAMLIAHSAARVNGVVDVRDKLSWEEDDL